MSFELEILRQAPALAEKRLEQVRHRADALVFKLLIDNLGPTVLPVGMVGVKGVRPLALIQDKSDWSRLVHIARENDYATQIVNTFKNHASTLHCVWNVGAAQGLYTLLASSALPNADVYAFEPDNDSAVRLEENVRLNQFKRTVVCRCALGNENTQLELHTDGCAGKAPSFHQHPKHRGKQTVEVKRGDSLISQQQYQPPDVLIIDVEGFEGPVLTGLESTMHSKPPSHIFLEMHPDSWMPQGYNSNGIIQTLKQSGYREKYVFQRDTQQLFYLSR